MTLAVHTRSLLHISAKKGCYKCKMQNAKLITKANKGGDTVYEQTKVAVIGAGAVESLLCVKGGVTLA